MRIRKLALHQELDRLHLQPGFFQALAARAQPARFARSTFASGKLGVAGQFFPRAPQPAEIAPAMLDDGDAGLKLSVWRLDGEKPVAEPATLPPASDRPR